MLFCFTSTQLVELSNFHIYFGGSWIQLDDEEKDTTYHDDLPENSFQGQCTELNIKPWTNLVLSLASCVVRSLS